MEQRAEEELRRRSIHLRALADIRAVTVTDGPGAGGRLLEVRTPAGLALDIALDRGGDLLRLSCRGHELGWHSATGAPSPWPALDSEDGLAFLRGFDGFLVTCGLDHHGRPRKTASTAFNYPLRDEIHHPLHGRIMATRAELLEKQIDWREGRIVIRLVMRQASVFGEVLELERRIEARLWEPVIELVDTVTNRGFRPTRHGVLYHFNIGYPLLDDAARLAGQGWSLADRLDGGGAMPADDHVEIVETEPSPAEGRIGIANSRLGLALAIGFDARALPMTTLWRAFQSGVFAIGLEPQTRIDDAEGRAILAAGESRTYRLAIEVTAVAMDGADISGRSSA